MLEDAKLLDEDYEEGGDKTWAASITVDGLTYATNLFWQPLQNTEDPISDVSEASEGILEGADLFCIKQGRAPQFGICVSKQGYKSGELVGAISAASALDGLSSFVAVFKVNTGWWYICVRNDIILSDGDMVFVNEEDAKTQFMSMLAVPDWEKKIAPAEWNIDGTEDIDLTELMKKGARGKLQKIKALRGTKLLVVISISAVVALWLLFTIIDSIFLAPPKKPMIAPIKPKVVQPVKVIPEVKPWEKLSDAGYLMAKCYENIAAVSQILPPGWNIGEVTCDKSGVKTSWTRESGRIIWADEALDSSGLQFSSRAISDDGNSMSVVAPVGNVPTVSVSPTLKAGDLKITINDLFQAIGQPVALSDYSYTSPQNTIYRSVKFKFTSVNNPMVWKDLLTKFSGLEIIMIKYNKDGEKWDYEGAIYAL